MSRADDFLPDGVQHWWEGKWLDLECANQFATVIDYANSYQTELKLEHNYATVLVSRQHHNLGLCAEGARVKTA